MMNPILFKKSFVVHKSNFVAILVLLMGSLWSTENHWEGTFNQNWNNPSNWSTGQIPTDQDDVIIDGEQDLVLSSNVELSSLKIESSYSGIFHCGGYTIKLNKGAFDAKYGGLDASQATLEFSGFEDQNFIFAYRENYGTIFNNKSSGALKFRSWAGLTVDTLKAAPGTLTELSRVGSITLNRYDIKGTASNRATLKSGADGERCIIFLKKGQNHVLSYVNLRDLWSLNGKGMLSDAHDHCIDGGNNRGFSFDHPVAYYTGLGEDENFSNPLNWGHGQVPSENHLLYLSKFMTNKDLVLDQDVKVAGIDTKRWRYAGRIRFGTHSMTVSGDFTPSTLMDTDEGTLILDGNQDQRVELVIPLELNRLEIKGEHRLIEFFQDMEVNELDIQTGDIRFMAESTVAVNDAMIIGETNPVNLRPGNDLSGTMNTPWNFVVHNSATVSNARVRGSNADGGLTVVATQTEDQGLNTNWTFDGALPFGSDSVIEFPETSAVSPAFVEGDYYFNATSIVSEAHCGSVNGQSLSDSEFFLNLPLDPSGVVTPVSVTFNEEELTKKEGEITWTTTILNAGGSMTIRKGDSLLFTYNDGVSANFRIDIDADGVYGDTVHAGSLLPTQFNEAGVIEVSVQADPNGSLDQNGEIIFEEVAIYTVTVVDVDLRAPIAVEVGFERGKNIVIEPASEISNISFESSDEEVVEVRLHEKRADGVRLSLTGMKRGFSSVISRLPNGQIVSALELDEFTLSFSNLGDGYLAVNKLTRLGDIALTMRPLVDDIDFYFDIFGSLSTLENGDTEIFFNSNDFEVISDNEEDIGSFVYTLVVPEGADHMCHGIGVTQAGIDLESVNMKTNNSATVEEDDVRVTLEIDGDVASFCKDAVATATKKNYVNGEQVGDDEEVVLETDETGEKTKTVEFEYDGQTAKDSVDYTVVEIVAFKPRKAFCEGDSQPTLRDFLITTRPPGKEGLFQLNTPSGTTINQGSEHEDLTAELKLNGEICKTTKYTVYASGKWKPISFIPLPDTGGISETTTSVDFIDTAGDPTQPRTIRTLTITVTGGYIWSQIGQFNLGPNASTTKSLSVTKTLSSQVQVAGKVGIPWVTEGSVSVTIGGSWSSTNSTSITSSSGDGGEWRFTHYQKTIGASRTVTVVDKHAGTGVTRNRTFIGITGTKTFETWGTDDFLETQEQRCQ